MFTIMENRKRPRLELINSNNNNSNETLQGVASTINAPAGMGTATLATIGGQSFILSNSATSSLPANILLSICDDNSDESEEYILDHTMLTQIKQEHTVATQTSSSSQNQSHQQQHQSQQPTLVTTMPQYRIINQAPTKPLNATTLNTSSSLVSNATAANSSLLTNSVHLPPGCEIYVIKEVIDSGKQVIGDSNNSTTSSAAGSKLNTTIKLEPMSPLPQLRQTNTLNGNSSSSITLLNTHNNNNSTSPVTNSNLSTVSTASSISSPEDTAKRSLILEAYKKRDDKRRATHNEVERRRRDKINSWIFKLKEMLPSDVTSPSNSNQLITAAATSSSSLALNQNNNSNTTRLLVQQQQQPGTPTTRTPPSDSKSQILIKACEYIKSMQEEIKSLRECLTENDSLRLSNQRLQDEINSLRTKQQQQNKLHNNNNTILLTTTTTNSSSNCTNLNSHHHSHNGDNSDDCEITLNSLNTTYANVQLFAPSPPTHQSHNHHLADLVGLTTTNAHHVTAASPPNTVNVTYAKRELIITDYVD